MKEFLQRFVFFPDPVLYKTPDFYSIPFENIFLSPPEHSESIYEKYHGWFLENNQNPNHPLPLHKYVILFFHGNAGNISTRLSFLKKIYETGFSILIFDYPGFGKSDGVPTESSCVSCASLFYQYLHETKKYSSKYIIFYGESIGGCIAAHTALSHKIPNLILQSTFTEIKNVILNHVQIPHFLVSSLGFQTLQYIKKRSKLNRMNTHLKTLVIHSQEDELIPFEQGRELAKYADDFFECEGKHCSPKINSLFLEKMIDFIFQNSSSPKK